MHHVICHQRFILYYEVLHLWHVTYNGMELEQNEMVSMLEPNRDQQGKLCDSKKHKTARITTLQ